MYRLRSARCETCGGGSSLARAAWRCRVTLPRVARHVTHLVNYPLAQLCLPLFWPSSRKHPQIEAEPPRCMSFRIMQPGSGHRSFRDMGNTKDTSVSPFWQKGHTYFVDKNKVPSLKAYCFGRKTKTGVVRILVIFFKIDHGQPHQCKALPETF